MCRWRRYMPDLLCTICFGNWKVWTLNKLCLIHWYLDFGRSHVKQIILSCLKVLNVMLKSPECHVNMTAWTWIDPYSKNSTTRKMQNVNALCVDHHGKKHAINTCMRSYWLIRQKQYIEIFFQLCATVYQC